MDKINHNNTLEDSESLNLHLAVISAVRQEHGIREPMAAEAIGEICGCSKAAIQHIERRALRKLRAGLEKAGVTKLDAGLFA